LDYTKRILVRKKGDKDYSAREKQMMVSLINDYSLFGATDEEMIKMLSIKLGKENNEKISETLFYRLKKEAVKKRGESEQWLDQYSRFEFVEFYRKRMEELELVQKKLLQALMDETEKEKQNKSLISQLSKTIIDNSKVLSDFGMSPPIVSRILDVVSGNYFNKINQESEELKNIKMLRQQAKDVIINIPDDNEVEYHVKEGSTNEHDPNRVF
jgi:hypothetical protein